MRLHIEQPMRWPLFRTPRDFSSSSSLLRHLADLLALESGGEIVMKEEISALPGATPRPLSQAARGPRPLSNAATAPTVPTINSPAEPPAPVPTPQLSASSASTRVNQTGVAGDSNAI